MISPSRIETASGELYAPPYGASAMFPTLFTYQGIGFHMYIGYHQGINFHLEGM